MKINVINNAKDINITVNESPEGFAILIAEKNKKTLGDVKPGEIVKLGEREYIVLEHSKETTAVITKDFVTSMVFGKTGDYAKSSVRTYLNGDFYKELCKAVGKEHIVAHTVNLECDDGSNKKAKVVDNVSLITTDLYRRYRELIPAYGSSWWTATGVTTLDKDYSCYVCYVFSCGILLWYGCDYSYGVRPFCILDSSISVS